MAGLDKNKYLVTKPSTVAFQGGEILDPDDFFVLRKGDMLAVHALDSYCANILMLLDLNEINPSLTEDQVDHLQQLANDVSDRSVRWRHAGSVVKVPD